MRRALIALGVIATTVTLVVAQPGSAATLPTAPVLPVGPDLLVEAGTAMNTIAVQQIELAVWQLEQDVGVFVEHAVEVDQAQRADALRVSRSVKSAPATQPLPVLESSRMAAEPEARPSSGGCCTDAQLHALNTCEAGGTNGWRTGYFGLETSSPIGGLSWDDQAAIVERTYAQSGAHAWGIQCAPILGG